MSKMHMSEVDCFFISFDEPNAEENWAALQLQCPWAQRVHGVVGFDAVHKRCATLSSTDRFITVDGDNLVKSEFFDLTLNIPPELEDSVLSWAGINDTNGLVYGNGGVKLWTREFVLNMQTHEHADNAEKAVDFCWDEKYCQLNGVMSTTYPNASAFQAFRAGFREGVKMTLDRGLKLKPADIKDIIHKKNLQRLLIWASIGADTPNGDLSIYGARLGIFMSSMTDWDISEVSDYKWMNSFWSGSVLPKLQTTDYKNAFTKNLTFDKKVLLELIESLGDKIRIGTGLNIAYFNENQSKFFKTIYEAPVRTNNPLATELEVDMGKY